MRGGVPESLRPQESSPQGNGDCVLLYNALRPHRALGYRTTTGMFHREHTVPGTESSEMVGSPGPVSASLTGISGFSLNSPSILSN